MAYSWYDSYQAAVLETDWTKMHERIHSAEFAIRERQSILSADHGGTPDERQAIADALSSIRSLRTDAASWLERQQPSVIVPIKEGSQT